MTPHVHEFDGAGPVKRCSCGAQLVPAEWSVAIDVSAISRLHAQPDQEVCTNCGGSGRVPWPGSTPESQSLRCLRCHGTGRIVSAYAKLEKIAVIVAEIYARGYIDESYHKLQHGGDIARIRALVRA